MEFMGIPIQGDINTFTDSMKPRYKLSKRVPDQQMFIYKGSVYGYNVYLQASYSRKSRTVYKVVVQPKNINEDAWLDSLVTHHGDYTPTEYGPLWDKPEGKILLYKLEGYDPVLMYMDKEGLTKFTEEKED